MNNDRFKFRVWDKKNKRYMENYASCSINESGILHVHIFGQHYELGNTEDFEVEQCTGLKDKNGNLIYENDLIKTANYKTGCAEIYVVKWCVECGLYELESTQSDQIIDMFRAEKGIICGNIHEQKDK